MKICEVTLFGETYDLVEDAPFENEPCSKCVFLSGVPNNLFTKNKLPCLAMCTEFDRLGHFEKHKTSE